MPWFKVKVSESGGYTYAGFSDLEFPELVRKVERGEYIFLQRLRYYDRGQVKSWESWDPTLISTIAINPAVVTSIMQFHDDPLTDPIA